jgi:hypothetical protein
MAKVIHDVVFHAIKGVVQKLEYILVSCDELTTINNHSWLSIHVYVKEEWKRLPILLNLQRVVDGSIIDNLTYLIIQSLVEYGGLNEAAIAKKLICFGANGVMVFHSVKSGVTIPFVSSVHYMAHCTNLVVQSLNKLNLVSKIKFMLTSIYNYFVHSPKRHLEANKLVEFLESKGSKTLKNIKTH